MFKHLERKDRILQNKHAFLKKWNKDATTFHVSAGGLILECLYLPFMAVHYSITARLQWSTIFLHCDWQVFTLRRPCWYTQEIRKWKQIRKMPQDCFHPRQIKWLHGMSLQSHVSRIDFTHLSKAAQAISKNTNFFPPACCSISDGSAWCVWSLGLKMARYLSSSENVQTQPPLVGTNKVLKIQ